MTCDLRDGIHETTRQWAFVQHTHGVCSYTSEKYAKCAHLGTEFFNFFFDLNYSSRSHCLGIDKSVERPALMEKAGKFVSFFTIVTGFHHIH
jgi:hypothetical protein